MGERATVDEVREMVLLGECVCGGEGDKGSIEQLLPLIQVGNHQKILSVGVR